MTEYRYSERGVIRHLDVFRARGGPTFKGARCGGPGLYKLLGIHTDRKGRVYLEACRCDKIGTQTGGTYLIYVVGKPYRSAAGFVERPYRVSKCKPSQFTSRGRVSSPPASSGTRRAHGRPQSGGE